MQRLSIPATIRELLRDEERAGNVVIWGAAAVCAACFAAAVFAIEFMR